MSPLRREVSDLFFGSLHSSETKSEAAILMQ